MLAISTAQVPILSCCGRCMRWLVLRCDLDKLGMHFEVSGAQVSSRKKGCQQNILGGVGISGL